MKPTVEQLIHANLIDAYNDDELDTLDMIVYAPLLRKLKKKGLIGNTPKKLLKVRRSPVKRKVVKRKVRRKKK